MSIQNISADYQTDYNRVVSHPLQSYEWGEFRKKTGVRVIRKGLFINDTLQSGFTLTLHQIPYIPWSIGYLPKGDVLNKELLFELAKIGKHERCVFIQLEPNIIHNSRFIIQDAIHNSGFTILNSSHPLFTKYTFQLDITRSEEKLLKAMHPKTRYNIHVAKRHGVIVQEDNSDEAFKKYLQLTQETTQRQHFYAHTLRYHQLMWETLRPAHGKPSHNKLSAHLLVAKYNHEILVTWILFVYKDTLYYPYGASSSLHKQTMASNLMMWEAIQFGKKLGLKKFDMWGALGPQPDPTDPWYGFHRFKQGYGAQLIEYIGSYDMIIHPLFYKGFQLADTLRWFILRRGR